MPRTSYTDMILAAFTVRDGGWTGGQWSPSYAFGCGSFTSEFDLDTVWEIVSGTLAELERSWTPTHDPKLTTEAEFVAFYELDDEAWCDYLTTVETLKQAVKHGWYADESHEHFFDPPEDDEGEEIESPPPGLFCQHDNLDDYIEGYDE